MTAPPPAPLLVRWADGPPLDPSPDDARRELRRELLRPEYHQENILERLLTWLDRQFSRTVDAASGAPPLTAALGVLVLLLLALAVLWFLSRARTSAREQAAARPVLGEESVTADELRARAEAATAAGRHEDAVVDGFRAIARRHVERGLTDDRPGATAREVADALSTVHAARADDVRSAARLFDLVHYGDRPASAEQAAGVLRLDDELSGVRR